MPLPPPSLFGQSTNAGASPYPSFGHLCIHTEWGDTNLQLPHIPMIPREPFCIYHIGFLIQIQFFSHSVLSDEHLLGFDPRHTNLFLTSHSQRTLITLQWVYLAIWIYFTSLILPLFLDIFLFSTTLFQIILTCNAQFQLSAKKALTFLCLRRYSGRALL